MKRRHITGLYIETLVLIVTFVTVVLVLTALQSGRQVKTKLEDDILPDLSEKTQEAIRKRQRRHWERKHGTNK